MTPASVRQAAAGDHAALESGPLALVGVYFCEGLARSSVPAQS